jgi:signal transduction histidine kinase
MGALRLTEGMEHERRRLAMDLHDQTLADLARVVRQISALRDQGSADAKQLAEFEHEIVSCLTELRHIVDDLRPGILELFGLADAVESYLNRSVRSASPPIAVRFTDTSRGAADDLPKTVQTALYRIVQEAINNAVRHAAPRRIEVAFSAASDALRLVVSDDGCGFTQGGAIAVGGIGHMRTRAALIGAQLSIDAAAPGRGTRVTVSLGRGRVLRRARPAAPEAAESL